VDPWTKPRYRTFYSDFKKTAAINGVRLDVPFFQLTPEEKDLLWEGAGRGGKGPRRGWGIKDFFRYLDRQKYKLHVRVCLIRYRGYALCQDCLGGRLRKEAYLVKVADHDIRSICQMSIEDARRFFGTVRLAPEQEAVAEKVLHEVRQRLAFLENVGLEY